MAVTQKVTLYNNKFTVPPVINAVQNDTDRQVEAYFGDFTLQVGMTGKLSFIRSDGTHYEVSATLNTGANTATAELDQALTQAGVTQAQLKITDSGDVGSTFTFMIKVQPDVAGISVPQDGYSVEEIVQRLTDAENAIDAVEEDVADLQDKEYDYAPVITDTASGTIATFSDGADGYPMRSVVAEINPVQSGSGDPSPDNVRLISGWSSAKVTRTGKNLIDGSKKYQEAPNNVVIGAVDSESAFHFFKAGTYTISFKRTNGIAFGVFMIDQDTTIQTTLISSSSTATNATFTLNKDSYIKLWIYKSGGIAPTDISGIQLETGSTATAYEPYNGQTFTIDLDGTRYGGTLDVRRGKLIVDRVMYVFTGNESQYVSVGQNRIAVKIGNNTKSGRAVCSDFANVETANNLQYIYITTSMTVDELKNYMTNHTVQCVYLLAQPIEVDLTPTEIKTLLGTNNLWSDTGDIEVEYCADTKLWILKKIAEALS